MGSPIIVDAVRSPNGKGGGWLSGLHAAQLLGQVQRAALERIGVKSEMVEQAIGGCVTQAGEQASNVTRTAWLNAGLSEQTGATTIDSQCGSGQQAAHLIAGQIALGAIDVGMACGVEMMSRVPLLSNIPEGLGGPKPADWTLDVPNQFVGADRIARRRSFTREDLDLFGLRSQQRAAAAWSEKRFNRQIVPVTVPGSDGSAVMPGSDGSAVIDRDQGLRETSIEALSTLCPVIDGGLHTAGTASQISDGATAAILMDESRARHLGLRPRARMVSQCLIGAEPEFLLDGPVQAAQRVLDRARMSMSDMDLIEVNEAFASVPMSMAQVHAVDPDKLNVNGGAIALGHPVGSTGIRLIAAIIDELELRDQQFGLIAVCAGGAMASAAIIERL